MKTKIISIAGGKGGTGKSTIAVSIGTYLASKSKKTLLIDLDLGSANLHTMLKEYYPKTGIIDFLENKSSDSLESYAIQTTIDNLYLLAANKIKYGAANLEYLKKIKLEKAILNIKQNNSFEYIIIDLGAGSNFNTLDFFSLGDKKIIITNDSPPAILGSYEFLKNYILRSYFLLINNSVVRKKIQSTYSISAIEEYLYQFDKNLYKTIENFKKKLDLIFIINNTLNPQAIFKLKKVIAHFLNIDNITFDIIKEYKEIKKASIQNNNPLTANPEYAKKIEDITNSLLL